MCEGCSVVLVTFHCTFMWMMRGPLSEPSKEDMPSVAHAAGAAKRRRERRSRQFLRHERLTVAMLLAESQHHAAPRRQSRARSGGWERDVLHGHVPEHPTTQVGCLPPFRGLTASLASGRRSGFSSISWTSLSTPRLRCRSSTSLCR